MLKTEQRRHKRYMKRCEVEVSTNGTASRGISSNFSLSGLYIKTSKPFSEDTPVALRIHLPSGLIAELKGIVRRAFRNAVNIQKNGMGIELTEKDSRYCDFISSFLPDANTDHEKRDNPKERKPIGTFS
jgi:hypothetical protein